jgi:aspartyl-tRNA(Asn)/glutamyl-tRNA(Gln) amidotransferase subunit A
MDMSIRQLHDKLKSGDVLVKELHDTFKKNIAETDTDINAYVEVFDDQELPELSESSSLLAGIPMSMKDNILIKGKVASASSKILENYTATYDSFVTKQLKNHGAVILGRTNMDEAAMGSSTETSYYGPTKNPLDTSRVPGGSSGGPAASVAGNMAVYALGSDTGGSVRQPAALCGLVGLKPTYGSVSRNGLIAMASSLDVIGPLTRSVDDARIVFNAINAYDPDDSTCVPLEVREQYQVKNTNKKVIGVPRSFLKVDGIDPEALENFETSLELMKEQGYEIVDIDIPNIEHSLAAYYIIQPAEVSSNLARYDGIRFGLHTDGENLLDVYKNTKGEGFGEEVKRRIMLGTHVLSSGYHDEYYYKAQALRNEISKNIYEVFDTVDVIATPTAPSVAFTFNEKSDPVSMYLQDIFTVPYNLSGNPAISVPSGTNKEGLPFGMHFVAPRFCEEKLLSVSEDFERAILKG